MIDLTTLSQQDLNKKRRDILQHFNIKGILDAECFADRIIKNELEDFVDDIVEYFDYLDHNVGVNTEDANAIFYWWVLHYLEEKYNLQYFLMDYIRVFGNYIDSCFDYTEDEKEVVIQKLNTKKEAMKGDKVAKFFKRELGI